MSEERKRILKMVAEGKISTQEAEDLLDALGTDEPEGPKTGPADTGVRNPKYMYVKVTGNDTVDVRIPLGLVRAGMRLTTLIPKPAMDQINSKMQEKGMSFDFNNVKPEDIEELIKNLGEMEVNVTAKNGDHVRVFCGE
jgi:Asp-tRNA(Asn)/Glu-tRNA(Gln) amidotransferase B subunit